MMARLRRQARLSKQNYYRKIEEDNALKSQAKAVSPRSKTTPVIENHVDDRDPIEMARAASSALRGAQ